MLIQGVDSNYRTDLLFPLIEMIRQLSGDSEKERDENHEYLDWVKTQVEECLKGIAKASTSKIIIAYEPVWAIGKNAVREATPAEFLEMRIFVIISMKHSKMFSKSSG